MVVVTPGADLQPIQEGTDWNIVLDISGSMSNKLSTAASGLSQALRRLRPEDRFRLVVFDNDARELVGWQPVTPDRVATAIREIETLGPGGGTNLYAGLAAATGELSANRTSAVVLVSDGGANVGPREHRAFLDLLARHDVRVFTFVMGQGANVPLLERIAAESGGFSMPVSNRDDLYGRLLEAQSKLSHEALHGVEIELDGARATDLTPRHPCSVYRGEQIVLFGRYAEPGFATLRLRARISGEPRSWETRVELPALDERYPELERLWAFARTRDLQRQIDDERADPDQLRAAIVDLAIEHSFVTEHTSMIVVRPEHFERYGIERRNARRVERERAARTGRANAPVSAPRVDQNAPMFDRPAPAFGGGALGPAAFVGLAALGGLGHLLRRRDRQ
jgi:Ca-activated chloride channel family protein